MKNLTESTIYEEKQSENSLKDTFCVQITTDRSEYWKILNFWGNRSCKLHKDEKFIALGYDLVNGRVKKYSYGWN